MLAMASSIVEAALKIGMTTSTFGRIMRHLGASRPNRLFADIPAGKPPVARGNRDTQAAYALRKLNWYINLPPHHLSAPTRSASTRLAACNGPPSYIGRAT